MASLIVSFFVVIHDKKKNDSLHTPHESLFLFLEWPF